MRVEETIEQLSAQHQPVRLLRFSHILMQTLGVVALSLVAVVFFYGVRPDLADQLSNGMFVSEISVSVLLIVGAAYATCLCAYPDRPYSYIINVGLALGVLIYSALLLMQANGAPEGENYEGLHHGMFCFLCIMSFAALPALFMVWKIKQLAPVRLLELSLCLMIMSVAVGLLGVRLVTAESITFGHALWHLAPMLAGVFIALLVGEKIFRW